MKELVNHSRVRRIGWMVDPSAHLDRDLIAGTAHALTELLDEQGCEVEPIEVERRRRLPRPIARSATKSAASASTGVIGRLLHRLQRGFHVLPARSLGGQTTSDGTLSYHLSCYARLSHTDMLVVTEGIRKKAFQTFRMSFLSKLVTQSTVPIMIIGPRNKYMSRTRMILIPVVDPEKSQHAFQNLLEFAQLSGAKVVVLFRFLDEAQSGHWVPLGDQFGSIPFFEPAMLLHRNQKLSTLSGWKKLGRQHGVNVEIQTDITASSFVESLLHAQKRHHADIIAVDPAFFASRYYEGALSEIIRRSPSPMWICHPVGQSGCEALIRGIESRLAAA